MREESLCMSDTAAAAMPGDSRGDLKGTVYELFILAISILSIINLVLLAVVDFESAYWWLVADIDIALTLIFVVDFIYRLRTAPSKSGYLSTRGCSGHSRLRSQGCGSSDCSGSSGRSG